MKTGHVMRSMGVTLAAGAVGAGIALLFAPQSGARTRRMIRRKAEDLGDGARKVYDSVKENGNGTARTLAYRLRMSLNPRKAVERLTGT
jgi:gas vesicle protein